MAESINEEGIRNEGRCRSKINPLYSKVGWKKFMCRVNCAVSIS